MSESNQHVTGTERQSKGGSRKLPIEEANPSKGGVIVKAALETWFQLFQALLLMLIPEKWAKAKGGFLLIESLAISLPVAILAFLGHLAAASGAGWVALYAFVVVQGAFVVSFLFEAFKDWRESKHGARQ